uniref:TFIIS N-terminal domain-containing protein n=1 Tax=Anopheles culicifacies TaxID=139723 RepID=A0A182MM19_9DIPT
MPRIDPMKLLVCLSVLLAPNGGIRNAGEVRRLANLMAKFSKKLVSKAIYIQILKCTETELLGQFMQTGGWTLVHTWLVDGIASKNWPLIQELLELLLCCPVDVERLKINSTPRLVKSLSTDSAHESVKVLATKLVEQWLYIVKAPKQLSPMVPVNQSELPATAGLPGITEGKQQHSSDGTNSVLPIGVVAKQGSDSGNGTSNHHQQNGYTLHATGKEVENKQQSDMRRDDVDGGKKSFQTVGGELQQTLPVVSPKKTSLVLKITTKNGKQVVAKVIKSNKKQQRASLGVHEGDNEDDDQDDDDEEEDQEEVVVNIESGKSSDETIATNEIDDKDVSDAKKIENQSQSLSSPKLSRKNSRDDGAAGSNDSGSESSSTTNTSANGAKTTKSASAATIPSKKASISIEVRNPENRPKTVKTYNSQFRSHGLIEEAPPPPSRKGLKKPSSTSPSTASTSSSSTTIGSTAIGTVKRSSPTPTGRDATLAGSPVEKKPREDPLERPGSIKLIPPKRQHALVESDMFMDALSATLRKDVKKRKRRTSGSEGSTTTVANSNKPGESIAANKSTGADANTTKVTAPGSPPTTTTATADDSASEATTPNTPTSPKVPTIAPMSFYRDTLAEQDEESGSGSTATEDGTKK